MTAFHIFEHICTVLVVLQVVYVIGVSFAGQPKGDSNVGNDWSTD